MSNNFKVGEKVIALTDSTEGTHQERISGSIYTVTAIEYCTGCGTQSINVNHKSPRNPHMPDAECPICGHSQPANNRGWTNSSEFTRPVSNQYKLEVAIPELLEIKIPQLQ